MASDLGNFGRLEQVYDRQLQECLQRKHHWEKMTADYQALSDRLSTISDKVSHEIMVPMGSLAFMPGKIVHTNEITVLLGDNWFVERSAKQAMDIVKRRMITCQNMLKDLDKEEEHILKWMKYSKEVKGDEDLIDIREEYTEEQDLKWREEHKMKVRKHKERGETRKDDNDHEELMQRLERLQIEEDAQNEERVEQETEPNDESSENLINFKHTETAQSETQLTRSTPYPDVPVIQSPLDIYKHFGIPTSETKSILKRRDSFKDEDGKKNHVRFADEELAKPLKEYKVAQPKSCTAFSGVIVDKTEELNVPVKVARDKPKTFSVFKQRKLEAQTSDRNQSASDGDSATMESAINESVQSPFPEISQSQNIENRPKTAFSAILERSTTVPMKPNEFIESKLPVSKFKAQRLQK